MPVGWAFLRPLEVVGGGALGETRLLWACVGSGGGALWHLLKRLRHSLHHRSRWVLGWPGSLLCVLQL